MSRVQNRVYSWDCMQGFDKSAGVLSESWGCRITCVGTGQTGCDIFSLSRIIRELRASHVWKYIVGHHAFFLPNIQAWYFTLYRNTLKYCPLTEEVAVCIVNTLHRVSHSPYLSNKTKEKKVIYLAIIM